MAPEQSKDNPNRGQFTEEYVKSCFEKIHNPPRGAKNNQAMLVYSVFEGRVNRHITIAELRAKFEGKRDVVRITSNAVARVNSLLKRRSLDLGIESGRYSNKTFYRLIKPSQWGNPSSPA